MNEEIKIEIAELEDFKGMVHSDTFKKFILDPLNAQLEDMKDAYDCDTLRQLHTIKGKKQGLQMFFNLIENIDIKIENKKLEELEKQLEK